MDMDVVHRLPDASPGALPTTKALDDLHYIRQCVENAGSFTAVPGLGSIVVGMTAVIASVVAAMQTTEQAWLQIWIAEFIVAALVGTSLLVRKARAARVSLASGPGRRFGLSLVPAVVAASALTAALLVADLYAVLPGMWLVLYGTAVVTGGAVSVRAVTAMGLSFMALGTVALFVPGMPDLFMGIGFGGLHVVFGKVIRERHGG